MNLESEILITSRRDSWAEIDRITKSDAPDKLAKCMNVGYLHYCLTGDDSLIHPALRESHAKLIEQLPDMITRAKAMARERGAGQVSLL